MKIFLIILAALIVIAIISSYWYVVIPLAVVAIGLYLYYSRFYFKTKKFLAKKDSIKSYVEECNELNQHINDLHFFLNDYKKTDMGTISQSTVKGNKNNKLKTAKYEQNILDCTRSVCDNARLQPFKYLCKYFNIEETEETLANFEEALNRFAAAEEGKKLLKNKYEIIHTDINKGIPFVVKKYYKEKLDRELGFDEYEFDAFDFPTYSFRYISAGGRNETQFDITMDLDTLERFENYLAEKIKVKNSAAGQRRLMTPKLRSAIKERDGYTCKLCGNSTSAEPNLLLEIDHIIPVSKGGLTTEDNLQTLCWKCNRHKSNKVA